MQEPRKVKIDATIIDSRGLNSKRRIDIFEKKSLIHGLESDSYFGVSETQFGKSVSWIGGESEGYSSDKSGKYKNGKRHDYKNDLRAEDKKFENGGWEVLIRNKDTGITYFMSARVGQKEMWASLDNIIVDNLSDFENYELVFKYTYVCSNPQGSIEYGIDVAPEDYRIRFSQMLEDSADFANRINWEVTDFLRRYDIEFSKLLEKNMHRISETEFGKFVFLNGGLNPQLLSLTQRILQFRNPSLRLRENEVAEIRNSKIEIAHKDSVDLNYLRLKTRMERADNFGAYRYAFEDEENRDDDFEYSGDIFSGSNCCAKIKSIEDIDDEPFDDGEFGSGNLREYNYLAGREQDRQKVSEPKVKKRAQRKRVERIQADKTKKIDAKVIHQKNITKIQKQKIVQKQKVEGVIFDLDGILSDSETAHRKSFNEVFAKYGVKPIEEKYWLKNYTGTGSQNVVRDIIEKNHLNIKPKEVLEKRREAFTTLIKQGAVKPKKGAKRLVKLVVKKGAKIIVASGGHRSHVRMQLDELGLQKIDFLGDEDVRRAKPAPDVFLKAAKRIGLPPRACLVIEDAVSGLRAAKRAGMKVILIGKHHPKSLRRQADLWSANLDTKKVFDFISKIIAGSQNKR